MISPMIVKEKEIVEEVKEETERLPTEDVLVSERQETEDNQSFQNSTARGPSEAEGFNEGQYEEEIEEDDDDEISGTLGDQKGFMLLA